MGRKTKTTRTEKRNLSNSEKRIEQLYIEAIRTAREGSLLPAKQTTDNQTDHEVGNTTKKSKRPEQILEEAIKKQQEQRRPQRRTFSVPVSRLVPFKNETTLTHGFQFPRDFKKDDLSLTWVPRANTASACGITEYDRSLWGDFSNDACAVSEICSRPSTSTDNRDDKVEQTLHIFPLRSTEDGMASPIPEEKIKSNLPPIYRTSVWREKVICCHGNRGTIPSRGEGWKDRGSVPLMIGKEELHNRRFVSKDTMSLAERRIALERSKRRRNPEDAGDKNVDGTEKESRSLP